VSAALLLASRRFCAVHLRCDRVSFAPADFMLSEIQRMNLAKEVEDGVNGRLGTVEEEKKDEDDVVRLLLLLMLSLLISVSM
jgi:hypothetical protein